MKKQIAVLLIAGMLFTASCAKAPEETQEETEKETTAGTAALIMSM